MRAERAKTSPAVAAVSRKKRAAGPTTCVTESKRKTCKARMVKDGQQYIKKQVLTNLEGIANALVGKAKDGGTAQLRLLWDLGKLDEDATAKVRRRAPSLSELLMKEIRGKAAAKKQAGK